MKKALLTLAAVALATSVYAADGVINFNNFDVANVTGSGTYSPGVFLPGFSGSPKLSSSVPTSGGAGAGYTAGLFLAGGTTPLFTSRFYNTTQDGQAFAGFEWGFAQNSDVSVTGSAPGTTPSLEIKVWETGKTWDTSTIRSAAGAGVFTPKPLGGPDPAGGSPFLTPTLSGFQGLVLVPEPSTYALGMLGLGALAMMRRRK
jgi:opacity protein-like surface antigen